MSTKRNIKRLNLNRSFSLGAILSLLDSGLRMRGIKEPNLNERFKVKEVKEEDSKLILSRMEKAEKKRERIKERNIRNSYFQEWKKD